MLAHLAIDFQHPTPLEGYHRTLYVKPSDHPSPVYSRTEVADILKRVRDSPAVTSEIYSGTSSFQGNLNRGSPVIVACPAVSAALGHIANTLERWRPPVAIENPRN